MKNIWIICLLLCILESCDGRKAHIMEDVTEEIDSLSSCNLDSAQALYEARRKNVATLHAMQQMELLRLRIKVRQQQPIDDESGVPTLASYFSAHGSEEEQLVSQYILASFLLDANELEPSYKTLCQIMDHGYSTKSYRSRDVLRRVYSALQFICIQNANYTDALQWGKRALLSGVYDEEEQYRIHYDMGNAYYGIGHLDSCKWQMEQALEQMMAADRWDDNMLICASEILGYSVMAGNREMADACYQKVDSHTSHGYNTTKEFNLGAYWHLVGNLDSATYHYRRASEKGTATSCYSACRQMAHLFRQQENLDSACHYQDLALAKYEEIYSEQEHAVTKRLNGLYKQKEQEEEIARNREQRLWLMLTIAVVTIAAFIGWIIVLTLRKRLLQERYEKRIVTQQHRIMEEELNRMVHQLTAKDVPEPAVGRGEEDESALLESLHRKCIEGKFGTATEFSALLEIFCRRHPGFLSNMRQRYPRIKTADITMCIMVLHGFSGKQIGQIMGYERQEIYHFMQRIMKFLAGKPDGRIESLRVTLQQVLEDDKENDTPVTNGTA